MINRFILFLILFFLILLLSYHCIFSLNRSILFPTLREFWLDGHIGLDGISKCDIKPINNNLKSRILQLLNLTDNILNQNNIQYISESGTLLGIIREGGLIPWDDDADIFIMEKDYNKLFSLQDEFNFHNLVLKPHYFGFKIFFKNKNISDKKVGYPFIDVFIRDKVGDKIKMSRTEIWKNEFFFEKELFPIKRYKFNNIYLNGPRDPIPYLDRTYPKWRFISVAERGHGKNKKKRIKCLKIL